MYTPKEIKKITDWARHLYGKTSLLSFESREGKQSLRKEMYSEQKRVFRPVHLS